MNQLLTFQLIASCIAGTLLGVLFFGGLWYTIKQLPKARHPWLLFLMSGMSRTLITLAGFWFVGIWLSETGRWQRMVACLLGFIIARYVCTRQLRPDNSTISGETFS
ncbi:ATP synthase subunit I [Gimesia fumaroli]|uniref:N-ATPase, AtpR subunit n=1 Tax=Gimesia fumaroli TaxID=2527976 RepID=A0A518IFR8_9PLAN|nr:ATP synthase subunit I [Gimesia fumaroli]QDV51926.1 N-ATPase, AtpR subunit [Gimesia fumaroli]